MSDETPILDGILNDLARETMVERDTTWLRGSGGRPMDSQLTQNTTKEEKSMNNQVPTTRSEFDTLVLSIYEAVGYPFDIYSPQELAKALFEHLGLPGHTADTETLEGLRDQHAVVNLILTFRHLFPLLPKPEPSPVGAKKPRKRLRSHPQLPLPRNHKEKPAYSWAKQFTHSLQNARGWPESYPPKSINAYIDEYCAKALLEYAGNSITEHGFEGCLAEATRGHLIGHIKSITDSLVWVTKRCESPIEQIMVIALGLAGVWAEYEVYYELCRVTYRHFGSGWDDFCQKPAGPGVMNTDNPEPALAHVQRRLFIEPQFSIDEYRVDVRIHLEAGEMENWHHVYMAVECDGHDWHERTKEQARRDKARDRALQDAGYYVYHYTGSEIWADVYACAQQVIRKLQACIDAVQETNEGETWQEANEGRA